LLYRLVRGALQARAVLEALADCAHGPVL